MATITTTQQFAEGNQVTADKLNNITNNSAFTSTVVDNVTTALDSVSGVANSKIIVKDGGITKEKLNLTASGQSATIATFKTTQTDSGGGQVGRSLDIKTPPADDLNSPFELATLNAIQFKVDDHTVTIDSDGKLGVGTTSPSSKFEVVGATLVSDDGVHDFVKQNVSGTTATLSLGNTQSTGGVAKFEYDRSSGKLQNYIGANTNSRVNYMTVTGTGNVGIGENSPSSILDITQASGSAEINLNATTNDAVLSLNSDTDENQDSEIHFNAGTNTRGKIEYNHHTTASSQKMSFFAGDNNERVTILGNGNVGIGDTAPDGKLHVGTGDNSDGTDIDIVIGGSTANSRQAIITKKIQSSDRALEIYASGSSSEEDIRFFSDTATESMRIQANGNVGIGVTNPSQKLHVKDGSIIMEHQASNAFSNNYTGSGTVVLRHGVTYGLVGTSSSTKFAIRTADTDRITTLANGNVGIGETNPANKLQVAGTLRATGNVDFDSNLNVDGDAQIGGNVNINGNFGFDNADSTTVVTIGTNSTRPNLGGGSSSDNAISTELAIKTYVDAQILASKKALYPVGSIFTSASSSHNTASNVASALGFGTWEAYGAGRVLVGKAGSGTFSSLGGTTGAETVTLADGEVPIRDHSHFAFDASSDTQDPGSVTSTFAASFKNTSFGSQAYNIQKTSRGSGASNANAGLTSNPTTSPTASAHNNIQPSIVVYMWKRTA